MTEQASGRMRIGVAVAATTDYRVSFVIPLLARVDLLHRNGIGKASRWRNGWAAALLGLAGGLSGSVAEVSPPSGVMLHDYSIAPVPVELVEAGRKAGVAVEGWEEAPDRTDMRKGDRVTFLVSAQNEGVGRHWLVDLVANDLKPAEQAIPPWPAITLHTSTGREHTFASERTAVAIHVVGPFAYEPGTTRDPGRKAEDVWSGALLNRVFLQSRLDHACLSVLALRRLQQDPAMAVPLDFGPRVGMRPFPAETVARDREVAERVGLSVEAERAYAGLGPALQTFFVLVAQTPGVRDIARETMNLSWLDWWKLARGTAEINIDFLFDGAGHLQAEEWGLPAGTDLYSLPFVVSLNGKPRLTCKMAVRAPVPPGQNAAGIVALAVGPPDRPEPYVMLRAVAAREAPLAEKP